MLYCLLMIPFGWPGALVGNGMGTTTISSTYCLGTRRENLPQVRERFAQLIACMLSPPVIPEPEHWDADGVPGNDGENYGRLEVEEVRIWVLGRDASGEMGSSDTTAGRTLLESSVDRSDAKQSENDWRSTDDASTLDFGSAFPGGGGKDAGMSRRFANGGVYVNGVGGSMSAVYLNQSFPGRSVL